MKKHNCPKNLRSIVNGKLITGCEECISTQSRQVAGNAQHFREYQKKQYRKELTQPLQPREYIKAYGIEAAREKGYSDESLRKYS